MESERLAMTRALRLLAILMAVAAVVDPAFAVRRSTPVPVDVLLPPSHDPGFAEASAMRESLLARLRGDVRADGSESAHAMIAIGNAVPDAVPDAPVVVVTLPTRPGISAASAPAVRAWWGQQPQVTASFRAHQMKGRETTFTLTTRSGAPIATAAHRWTQDVETFAPAFTLAPSQPGVTIVRIAASGEGLAQPASVDVPVSVEDRRARILVFEPRPSWGVSFARQALEADPLFDVQAIAQTSRGITTQTTAAPDALAQLDPDAFDTIVAGGLEALGERDLAVLRRFVEDRGGSLILVPDGKMPPAVASRFALPATEEMLVERPAELRYGSTVIHATELLRPSGLAAPTSPITAVPRGRGQVLVAVALDAWRFRAEKGSGYAAFWRSVTSASAMAAVPPVVVSVEPAAVRTGDPVTVRAWVRDVHADASGISRLPAASAALVGPTGEINPLRLWPGAAAGEFVAVVPAPPPGRYDVRIDLEGLPRRDAVLLVDDGHVSAAPDRSRSLAFLAEATGGSVMASTDLEAVADRIRAIPRGEEPQTVRPTRSAWWMLACVALLCGEWAIRRRRGLR